MLNKHAQAQGGDDSLDGYEDPVAGTVSQLVNEVQELQEGLRYLWRRLERVEKRSGRGLPHPAEALDVEF